MYIRYLVLSALMTLPFSMVHANDWSMSFTEKDCNQDMKECKGSAEIGGGRTHNYVVACENKDGMQYIPKTVEVACTWDQKNGDTDLVDLINYKEGSKDYRMKVARPNSKTGEYQVFGFYMDNKAGGTRTIYFTLDCSSPAADNKPYFWINNGDKHQCGPNKSYGAKQSYQEVIDDGGIQIYDGTATFDLIPCKNTQNNCYR